MEPSVSLLELNVHYIQSIMPIESSVVCFMSLLETNQLHLTKVYPAFLSKRHFFVCFYNTRNAVIITAMLEESPPFYHTQRFKHPGHRSVYVATLTSRCV